MLFIVFFPHQLFVSTTSPFIHLFVLSPRHIYFLTFCLLAGVLSAVSLSQILALSLKTGKPFNFYSVLSNVSSCLPPFIFLGLSIGTKHNSSAVITYVQ